MINKIHLIFQGSSDLIKNPVIHLNQTTILIPYPCKSIVVCHPYKITFPPGSFYVELYGGSGGNVTKSSYSSKGGKGGKVSTVISGLRNSFYYLYIGSHGMNADDNDTGNITGGYNGGGKANQYRGGGGGATDLRRVLDSFPSRILVVAGGGGAYANPDTNDAYKDGGDGGGLNGEAGECLSTTKNRPCIGSQSNCINGAGNTFPGYEGLGSTITIDHKSGGGGGAGYYGGGSSEHCSSSGGSSYFSDQLLISDTKTGVNIGNGYAQITYLGEFHPSCKRVNKYLGRNSLSTYILISCFIK